MVDLKRQNILKAGTDKPKLKLKYQMSGKDFLKSHILLQFHATRKYIYTHSLCHSLTAARNRLWVVAPSTLTDPQN